MQYLFTIHQWWIHKWEVALIHSSIAKDKAPSNTSLHLSIMHQFHSPYGIPVIKTMYSKINNTEPSNTLLHLSTMHQRWIHNWTKNILFIHHVTQSGNARNQQYSNLSTLHQWWVFKWTQNILSIHHVTLSGNEPVN